MDTEDRRPSRQSLRALDALNLALADVRDGLGPYLAIYLATRHWSPDRVGLAMAAMGVAAVAAQGPAGWLIDRTTHKRTLMVGAAILIALSAVAMVRVPSLPVILGAQATLGVASTVFAPAIAAVSLGMVGHARMAARTGRNEAFNHAGNVVAAILAGVIGDHVAFEGVFYLLAAMCGLSVLATASLRPADIDDDLARGGDGAPTPAPAAGPGPLGVGGPAAASWGSLLLDRRIAIFAASVVLFHFSNAAMLPLVGQKLAISRPHAEAGAMSACIIAAQVVMVPVAIVASRLAETRGRRATFLVGFAVLPVRGLLYTLTDDPRALVAIQLLDGIGAGIFGVVGVLSVADLARGTGRFNLLQGALATATGLGAAASNYMTGLIVRQFGFDAGFLALAAIAGFALAFYALLMPETRDAAATPAADATAAEVGAGAR